MKFIDIDFFFNWPVPDDSEGYEISVMLGQALGQQVTFGQHLTSEDFENSVFYMTLASCSYWYFALKFSHALEQFWFAP